MKFCAAKIFFLLLIVLLCSVLSACSTSTSRSQHSKTPSALALARLNGYNLIQNSVAQEVLGNISARLHSGLKKASKTETEVPAIFLVRSPKCLALNQDGVLLVSDHLISKLDHQSELVFILAHELAHIVLGHHAKPGANAYQHEMELDADYVGLRLMALAGYNPWYSIDALIKAYSCNYWADSGSHPSLQARADALSKNLASLGFGHSNSESGNRDFQKLKYLIAQGRL